MQVTLRYLGDGKRPHILEGKFQSDSIKHRKI